jgi:hypothetical protein
MLRYKRTLLQWSWGDVIMTSPSKLYSTSFRRGYQHPEQAYVGWHHRDVIEWGKSGEGDDIQLQWPDLWVTRGDTYWQKRKSPSGAGSHDLPMPPAVLLAGAGASDNKWCHRRRSDNVRQVGNRACCSCSQAKKRSLVGKIWLLRLLGQETQLGVLETC